MVQDDLSKRQRVRIFCDHEAAGIWDYPFGTDWEEGYRPSPWHENSSHAPDLPILSGLARWNEQYSVHFNAWSWPLELGKREERSEWFDPDAFTRRGLELAHQLKRNHPDWDIVFFDEVAWTRAHAIDANTPLAAYEFFLSLAEGGGFTLIPASG